jgi:hypothetical protein
MPAKREVSMRQLRHLLIQPTFACCRSRSAAKRFGKCIATAKSAPPSRVSSFRGLPQRANSDKSTDDDEDQFSLSYLRMREK